MSGLGWDADGLCDDHNRFGCEACRMTNPNPSPEEALRHLELLALNTAQTSPAARKVNECVSILTAALSQTLPAPGEALDRACERSWDATHRTLWRHTSEEKRAEWATGISEALATVAAANDEGVAKALEQQMEAQDEYLPSSIARERGLVWLDGWFDISAALAASRSQHEGAGR